MANAAESFECKRSTRPRSITISSLNCEEVNERMKRWKEEDEHYYKELAEMEERHQKKVYQLMDDQDAAQRKMDKTEEAFSRAVRETWHDDNKELKGADVERRKARDELHKLVWEMENEYHVHGRAVKDFNEKYDRQVKERKPAREQQTLIRSEEELLKPEDFVEDEDMEDDAPQEFLDEHQSELHDGEHGDCSATTISTSGVFPTDLSPQLHHGFDLPIRSHPNRFSFLNRFIGICSTSELASTQGPAPFPAAAAAADSESSPPSAHSPASPHSTIPVPSPLFLEPSVSSATSPAIPAFRYTTSRHDPCLIVVTPPTPSHQAYSHPSIPDQHTSSADDHNDDDDDDDDDHDGDGQTAQHDDDLSTHPPLRLVDTPPLWPPAPPSSPTIPTDDLSKRRNPARLSESSYAMRDASNTGTPTWLLARQSSMEAWAKDEALEQESAMDERDDGDDDGGAQEEERLAGTMAQEGGDAAGIAGNRPAAVSPCRRDDDDDDDDDAFDALPFVACHRRTATPFRCGAASPPSSAAPPPSSSSSHTISPDLRPAITSSARVTFGGLDGAMDDDLVEECWGCEDVGSERVEKRGAEGAGGSKGEKSAGAAAQAKSYSQAAQEAQKQQPVSGEAPSSGRYVFKHTAMSGKTIVVKVGRKSAKSHANRPGKEI